MAGVVLVNKTPLLTAILMFLLLASAGALMADSRPVTIGLFLPDEEVGKEVHRGARMAAARVNRQGGIDGRLLRLVAVPSDQPWGGASGGIARLIYTEEAVAVIGGLDGQSAHIAQQVITRARGQSVFITPWASEQTLTQIGIPWFYRMVPDDRAQAELLLREIFSVRQYTRVALWIGDNFAARAAAEAFLRFAPSAKVHRYDAQNIKSNARFISNLKNGKHEAVVVFDSALESARILIELRHASPEVPFFGPLWLTGGGFISSAGDAAEGAMLVAPDYISSRSARSADFRGEYENEYASAAAPPAFFAYDAVNIIIAAIRSGRDRPDNEPDSGANYTPDDFAALLSKVSMQGVTGMVEFGSRCSCNRQPVLAVVRGSVLRPLLNGVADADAEEPVLTPDNS